MLLSCAKLLGALVFDGSPLWCHNETHIRQLDRPELHPVDGQSSKDAWDMCTSASAMMLPSIGNVVSAKWNVAEVRTMDISQHTRRVMSNSSKWHRRLRKSDRMFAPQDCSNWSRHYPTLTNASEKQTHLRTAHVTSKAA